MQVFLFRHGQTAGNAVGKYVGVTDEPLCDRGVEAARAAGCDRSVREVLVSPLLRTQMTAAILFPNAKQTVCPGLREMDFGVFDGRTPDDMADDEDYRRWVEETGCMGPCPHGETTLVFQHRVCAAFRREALKAIEAGQDRLYLVIHGGVIMSILHRYACPEAPFYSWLLKNCQGYRCTAKLGPEGLQLTDAVLLERVAP